MVSEDQIRRICAQAFMHNLPLSALPPSFHWAGILNMSLVKRPDAFDAMSLGFCRGSVFTGPEGNGRHSYAWAMANTLMRDAEYKGVYVIHGCNLDFEDPNDIYTVLQYLKSQVRSKGKLVLLVDQPELSEQGILFQHQLACLQQSLLQEGRPLFLMVISDSLEHVAPAMLRQFPHYHCPRPNAAAVADFVKQMLEHPVPVRLENLTALDIIQAAQGFSWRQLTDLHNQLLRLIVSEYVADPGRFQDLPEADVYRKGLIRLSQSTVRQILHSASLQNSQTVPVPMPLSGTAGASPAVHTDSAAAPAQSTAAPEDTGLSAMEILRMKTQGLMTSP